ncbi:MAG: cytochrome c biogenesis protein CcsA [Gammaproteobacteria bacterium]|nr:cytochrome c biogenesis protein CcsA [Gammaproteobacteria bacterium]
MLETLELYFFYLAFLFYASAWIWHLQGWRKQSSHQTRIAIAILWAGWVLNCLMVLLRWYRAEHVPMLSAFEFVTFFALLVTGVFLIFSLKEQNRMLGVFLLPVSLMLMVYAAFMPKDVEPELPIFDSLLLQFHILTTLLGYAAWTVTFAASVSFLYLDHKKQLSPNLFDQMAYRAAFFALSFLTLGILTGALWGDRVFGQLWFWDPKETWSLITWLIFLAYLHARYTLDWRGRRAAILAIIGFMALVFTYVGVDFLLPQIHGTMGSE